MIYGAYGYTGKLLVQEALNSNMTPIVAGRDAKKIHDLSQSSGLEPRAFKLENAATFLEDVELVVNCAGPFSKTFGTMVQACISTGTHYLDITGEVYVFEQAKLLDKQAKDAKIIICPGAGFDVVPTDCLALKLKQEMPEAIELELGFDGLRTPSAGTAKTVVENISKGSLIRESEKIKTIPPGSDTRTINFGNGERLAMAIPWGDISTAYTTTSIPNIKVYTPTSKAQLKILKQMNKISKFLEKDLIQELLFKLVEWKVKGPDESKREKETSFVWGMVRDAKGNELSGRIRTSNGYTIAAIAPVHMVQKLLSSSNIDYGYTTPAQLMGPEFIRNIEGSSDWEIF